MRSYYDRTAPTCTVNVLGTEYRVWLDVPESEDEMLKACNGYCDKTVKRIVVCERNQTCELADYTEYRKYCMRHELVHAFLFESGHGANTTWDIPGEEHPEHMVEWIGMQFPKILNAFQAIGAL